MDETIYVLREVSTDLAMPQEDPSDFLMVPEESTSIVVPADPDTDFRHWS